MSPTQHHRRRTPARLTLTAVVAGALAAAVLVSLPDTSNAAAARQVEALDGSHLTHLSWSGHWFSAQFQELVNYSAPNGTELGS
jgi:hypothetical protein